MAARVPQLGGGLYSASKAAVVALTQQSAVEWGPLGVRVNAIGPGMIRTAMAEAVYADEDLHERRRRMVPLGRIGLPEDIGRVVAFLLSPDAGYVTGQHIVVDGGLSDTLVRYIPSPEHSSALTPPSARSAVQPEQPGGVGRQRGRQVRHLGDGVRPAGVPAGEVGAEDEPVGARHVGSSRSRDSSAVHVGVEPQPAQVVLDAVLLQELGHPGPRHRCGRAANRPATYAAAPPPWETQTSSRGCRSSTPPKTSAATASVSS